jgi:hypothetical protein
MSYQNFVTFTYTSKESESFKYDSSFPELLPEETVTIEVPCYDLNVHQYFAMFRKFLAALGFCEQVILDGAFHFAFSDSNTKEFVDKLMEEYEIQDKQDPYLSYNETEVIREFLKGEKTCLNEIKDERIRETLNLVKENIPAIRDFQWEKIYYEYRKNAEAEILDLKAKLSRLENPDNPNYTDEEIEAMSAEESYKLWGDYIPGSPEAVEKFCTCPVMDNAEMPDDRKWVSADCPLHGKVK